MSGSGSPSLFDDGKEPDALRTIGELADAVGIKQHVLRYWEQQFPMLKPLKRSGGRRYYRPQDVELVQRIDRLVNTEGYTLKGAKQALSRKDDVPAAASPAVPPPAAAATDVASHSGQPVHEDSRNLSAAIDPVPQLRAIRDRLERALAAS